MEGMKFEKLSSRQDAALAGLIRKNLEANRLDIPGTAYFDESLDHLSGYYGAEPEKRVYYVLLDEEGRLAGGVGLAEFGVFADCAELQKLYLDDRVKGRGLGYRMMEQAERAAGKLGYRRIYLETHDNLKAAIHLYERCGYKEIEKPAAAVHGSMNRFFLKELK